MAAGACVPARGGVGSVATTLDDARTLVRLLIQQVTPAAQTDLSNTDLDFYIHDAYRWWFDHVEKRAKDVQIKASMTASSWIVTPETSVLYPEILEVYLVTASADKPLQPMAWSEIRNRQQANDVPAEPSHVALRRIAGAAPSGSTQNRWEMAVYPLPDQTYEVRGLVRDYPADLGSGSAEFQLGDFEARCVAMLAAIFAAPGSARPDLAESVMWFFPQAVRDKVVAHATRDEAVA